ncbi:MAG: ZIP family metal transporter [Roseovarius sp.]|jgi:ZIP family zinc transporter|uniref:ZIP family metal transporter n=1 Tax=Roseovarius sp. TaxID=1486281 RepID=UPI0026101567|nr:divalent cation transporter [Roseovarius sp.]
MAGEGLWSALLLALIAGAAMPLGAALALSATCRRLPATATHTIVAFGGGALLAAIALVLVPHARDTLSAPVALSAFAAGGVAFFAIDRALESRGGRGAQLMAMLLDFLPEAMAIGAMLTAQADRAVLLAGLIFLQNLPEGFAAFRDIRRGGAVRGYRIVLLFAGLALLGPVCAGLGFSFLSQMPQVLGGIMMFAAGGILYLIFQDIAPAAHARRSWLPPLGAVFGFTLGLAGDMLIG